MSASGHVGDPKEAAPLARLLAPLLYLESLPVSVKFVVIARTLKKDFLSLREQAET